MSSSGGPYKGLSVLLVSLLAVGIAASPAAPTAKFISAPDGNPVVGQVVQFTDTSGSGSTSWQWDFGDGQTSTDRNPTHVFGGPGVFNVTLTVASASGSTRVVQQVVVTPVDLLQLNNRGNHPFSIKLTAADQRTGRTVVTVNLVASNFRWDFDGGGDAFTFHVGQPYQLRVSRSNGIHAFSGMAGLGCSAADLNSTAVCNFTPTAAQIGLHPFSCTVSSCGSGHSQMLGGRAFVAQ